MRSGGVCYVGGGSFLLVLKGGVRGVRKQALWLAGVFLEAVAWHGMACSLDADADADADAERCLLFSKM